MIVAAEDLSYFQLYVKINDKIKIDDEEGKQLQQQALKYFALMEQGIEIL